MIVPHSRRRSPFRYRSQSLAPIVSCVPLVRFRSVHSLESDVNGMKHAVNESDGSRHSGATMEVHEQDLEESYFQQTGKTVDKSIGYVMVGLGVFFFFSLFLLGMSRVQNASDQIVSDSPPIANDSEPEISDRVESARN